jgi:hypothetical protein
MAETQKITVEIEGNHTFELEPPGMRDAATEARAVFAAECVVEQRAGGAFTVWPVSRVTAVYVGDVPKRRVGFPTVPRVQGRP